MRGRRGFLFLGFRLVMSAYEIVGRIKSDRFGKGCSSARLII